MANHAPKRMSYIETWPCAIVLYVPTSSSFLHSSDLVLPPQC